MMIHICNPSSLAKKEGSLEVRNLRPVWATSRHETHLCTLTHTEKNSWAWWFVPVISAAQEAEEEGLLEPSTTDEPRSFSYKNL